MWSALENIRIYALARRYGILSLMRTARHKFEMVLAAMNTQNPILVEIVRYLYWVSPMSAMQDAVASRLQAEMKRHGTSGLVKDILYEFPDIAVKILQCRYPASEIE